MSRDVYCSCGTYIGARLECPLPWCPSHRRSSDKLRDQQMFQRGLDDITTALDESDWDTARTLLEKLQLAHGTSLIKPTRQQWEELELLQERLLREWPDAHDSTVWWFGPEPWGADVCKTCRRVEVPAGARCMMSDRIIMPGDRGFVVASYDGQTVNRRPILYETMLASVGP